MLMTSWLKLFQTTRDRPAVTKLVPMHGRPAPWRRGNGPDRNNPFCPPASERPGQSRRERSSDLRRLMRRRLP